MMSSSIYGLNNYYSSFISPLKSYQVNPITNLMYGALASSVYAKTVAKSAQSTVSSYLSSMNNVAGSLKTAAKPLFTPGTGSSFSKKAVASSDSGSATGTATWNADIKSYSLSITRLATGQTNKGGELSSDGPTSFSKGLNTFTMKSGNSERTVAFTVNEKDTNRTSLNKMAAAINKSGIGITASVATGSKPNTAYIKLSSTKTGTDSAFSLTDTTGNAVTASGAGAISEKAENALYTLDGKQYESQSNTVDINNGKVSITMNKADGREIKLSVGSDGNGIQNDIKDFVKKYNDAVTLSGSYSDTLQGAELLEAELQGIVSSRVNTLSNIGITKNSDGTLKIDEAKLAKAVEENSAYVQDIFSGTSGVATKAYSKANEMLQSPLKYSYQGLANNDSGSYNSLMSATLLKNAPGLYNGMVLDLFL